MPSALYANADDSWEHIELTYPCWSWRCPIGILFQADNVASYIPLLYNVTGSGGLVSYYRTAWGSPPGDVFTLTTNSVVQDTLFPLISLEICKSNLTMTVYTVHQSVVSKVTIYTAQLKWTVVSLYEGTLIHYAIVIRRFVRQFLMFKLLSTKVGNNN